MMYKSTIWEQLACSDNQYARVVLADGPHPHGCIAHAEVLTRASFVALAFKQAHTCQDCRPPCARAPAPPVVALLLPRSLQYVVAATAVLAAGAAFLPLDPHWPLKRLQHILSETQPCILVHSTDTAALAAAAVANAAVSNSHKDLAAAHSHLAAAADGPAEQADGSSSDMGSSSSRQPVLLSIDTVLTSGNAAQPSRQQVQQQLEQVNKATASAVSLPYFCVLYTSGSTGAPLGVLCTEQGFLNRYAWMQRSQVQPQSLQEDGQLQELPTHRSGSCHDQQLLQQPQPQQEARQQQQQQQHLQEHRWQEPGPVPLQPGHVVAYKTATTFVDHLWELLAPLLSGADMLLVPAGTPPAAAGSGHQLPTNFHVAGALEVQQHNGGLPGRQRVLAAGGQQQEQSVVPRVDDAAGDGAMPAQQGDIVLQPEAFTRLLVDAGVTHLAAVPSLLELWLPQLQQHRGRLKLQQLVSSGEPLSHQLATLLLVALPPHCVLLNLYGSTEVSADATCQVVTQQQHLDGNAASRFSGSTHSLTSGGSSSSSTAWVPAGNPISGMAVAIILPCSAQEDAMQQDLAGQALAHKPTSPMPPAALTAPTAAAANSDGAGCSAAAELLSGDVHDAAAVDQSSAATLELLPIGAVGEVAVTGIGLAAGYLGSSSSTTTTTTTTTTTAASVGCGDSSSAASQAQTVLGAIAATGRDTIAAACAIRDAADKDGTIAAASHNRFVTAGLTYPAVLNKHSLPPPAQRQQQQQQQQQQETEGMSLVCGSGVDAMQLLSGSPQLWFRTGDLGCIGTFTGTLHITGRCSLQVKVRGVRVDLQEVEQTLGQHPLVAAAAAAAWPHPSRPQDNILVAYVVLNKHYQQQQQQQHEQQEEPGMLAASSGVQAVEQQQQVGTSAATAVDEWQQRLRRFMAGSLPSAAQPGVYMMMTHLPRSPAGKVFRSHLPNPGSLAWQQQQQQQQQQEQQHQHLQQQEMQQAGGAAHEQQLAQWQQHKRSVVDSEQHNTVSGSKAAHEQLFSEVAVMRVMLAALPGPRHLADAARRPAPPSAPEPAPALASTSVSATAATAPAAPAPYPLWPLLEPTDDLFTAGGGDSLAAAAVAAALGIDVGLVFAHPTARSLSAFLRNKSSSVSSSGHKAGDHDVGNEARSGAATADGAAGGGQVSIAGPLPDSAAATAVVAAAGEAGEVQQHKPKRRRLLGAASADDLGRQEGGADPALPRLLAAATAAMVVGPASRVLAWALPAPGTAGGPAGDAKQQGQQAPRLVQQQPPGSVHPKQPMQQQPQEVEQHEQQEQRLSVQWKVPLGRCVDAAPLLLGLLGLYGSTKVATAAAGAGTAALPPGLGGITTSSSSGSSNSSPALPGHELAAYGLELVGLAAFACSHDGRVVCCDVATGTPHWTTTLPARADAGLCLSRCCTKLAVAAGDARLYCLCSTDGRLQGTVALGGDVRAAPVTDPWWGLWWVVTHGRELLVVRPDDLAVLVRLPLPAAGSAAVAFAAQSDSRGSSTASCAAAVHDMALVALLDGSLLAVDATLQREAGDGSACTGGAALSAHPAVTAAAAARITPETTGTGQQQQQQPQAGQQQAQLRVLWTHKSPAPIFSSPVASGDVVVAAAVSGVVVGLARQTGQQLWQVQLPSGHVFADLLLLQPQLVPRLGQPGPLSQCQQQQQQVVVAATQSGVLFGLSCTNGRQVFCSSVGDGSGVSAAPATAVTWRQLAHMAAAAVGAVPIAADREEPAAQSTQGQQEQQVVVVCSKDGALDMLQADAWTGKVEVTASVMLPEQVFSSPVAAGPFVVFGCRDDTLYCLNRQC